MAQRSKPVVTPAGTDRETIISIILGAIVVIVIGSLAFRYLHQGGNVDQDAQLTEDVLEPSIVEVEELPSEVITEETAEGEQVPTNLPARYTVKPGDSTWAIAQAFYGSGFNYIDIESANNLEPEQELAAGMELIIPKVSVRDELSAGAPREPLTINELGVPPEQITGPTKGDDSQAEAALEEMEEASESEQE
jgi:LysM repeat protein